MPQPPPKLWKRTIFGAIALAEHALRGDNFLSQTNPQQIRNFLFLQYDAALGSVLHATPIFETLKCAEPDAHITVAASSIAASILNRNPYIDSCVVTPGPGENFNQALRAVRELLQSMPPGPGCIATTIGNRRPRIALLSLFAGKALHIGHTAAPELYDLPLTFHPERGQIEGNLDILRAMGHNVSFCEPQIFFTHRDADAAAEWLQLDPLQPRIAFITQNSGAQRNRWRSDRFRNVIAQLTQTFHAAAIFPGTASELPAIEALRQSLSQPGISIAGKTTIPQLAAALAQCDLVVSLDTGAFHVARAVGLPAVVLAPAWQNPREWLPIDHPRYRVLRGLSIPTPPPGYYMEEISVEQVVGAATELLEQFPASTKARQARLYRAPAQGSSF